MSITRALVRIATARALSGATLAGDAIFDSVVDPLDQRISSEEKRPVIAIYTDDHGGDVTGKGDYFQEARLDLVIEIVIAGRTTVIVGDDEEAESLSIPNTDDGFELTLDLIETQAIKALVGGQTEWAALWRILVTDVSEAISRRGVSAETGTRFAVRQLTLNCGTLIDPDSGGAVDDDSIWGRAFALMEADPHLADRARIMRQVLEAEPRTDWRRAAARLGVNLETISALGLGPVGADDPVPFIEGSIDGGGS